MKKTAGLARTLATNALTLPEVVLIATLNISATCEVHVLTNDSVRFSLSNSCTLQAGYNKVMVW